MCLIFEAGPMDRVSGGSPFDLNLNRATVREGSPSEKQMWALLGVVAFVSAFAICEGARATERGDFPGQDKAYRRAFQAIRQHKILTPKEMECLSLVAFGPAGRVVTVDVRENRSRSKCGGEPAAAPRLFSIDIDLETGGALWDGDDPGEMRPLPFDGGRPVPVDQWDSLENGWNRYTGGRFGTVTEVPRELFDGGKPTLDGRKRAIPLEE
jgi:hypothetical protein